MRCYPDALSTLLKKNIHSHYLLYGNEPLLVEESAILVRAAIKSQEMEHLILSVDNSNNSSLASLPHLLQDRSLFSQKRLIEIRITAKLTASDTSHLEKIFQTQDDTLLLIYSGQLSRQNQQAKWFTFIEQKGVVVAHWPLSPLQFTKWVENRVKQQKLRMAPEALRLLIYHTEGNCLAAKQEIERLSLCYDNLPETALITQLDQQSQFDVFDLCEATLQEQPERVIKILHCLKISGSAPPHLLWAMAQTLRVLLRCLSTSSLEEKQLFLQQAGIRTKSHSLYLKALKIIKMKQCTSLLAQLSLADKQLKTGDMLAFWRSLLEVSLKVTGNLSLT